jgi:hypothetical protein
MWENPKYIKILGHQSGNPNYPDYFGFPETPLHSVYKFVLYIIMLLFTAQVIHVCHMCLLYFHTAFILRVRLYDESCTYYLLPCL